MNYRKLALLALIVMLLSAACDNMGATTTLLPAATTPGDAQAPSTPPPPAIATNTAVPPTPTPTEPLAALVNGEPIFLADYDAEVARYEASQSAVGAPTTGGETDYREQVLNTLIERQLILQAAAAAGVVVTPETVEQRLADLRAAGDEAAFQAFLQANQWTEEEFRQTLEAEIITGEMVARVTADVPNTMEQVRASYIQMDDGALAQQVWDRAQAGDDFAFLAEQNSVDRVTGPNGGDLGFFTPGSLLVPEVEAAAFALQPGEISDLITVTNADGTTTYYIIKVTERDPDRELTAEARYDLLQAAFEAWLDGLWGGAMIERFVQ